MALETISTNTFVVINPNVQKGYVQIVIGGTVSDVANSNFLVYWNGGSGTMSTSNSFAITVDAAGTKFSPSGPGIFTVGPIAAGQIGVDMIGVSGAGITADAISLWM